MIPIHLRLAGFLSYREPVELDFTGFDVACISGPNGAGKSSLLDAITWALFGQARKRDDSLINLHPKVKAAEVTFTFAYEGNTYRVQRTLPRGKTTRLEFQIWSDGQWRPLTGRTLRATQAYIEDVLRLDYETFVNAAFFLQGKADQFTQQTASKRKQILGNILGLEIWETYRERTAERRRALEEERAAIEGRLQEIEGELAEEEERKDQLRRLEDDLKRLTAERERQEKALEDMKRLAASLAEQRKLVEALKASLERSLARREEVQKRLEERQARRDADAELLARADEIEAAYQAWQSARAEVEKWDELAARFRDEEKRRQPLLEEIAAERARLEQERENLEAQARHIATQEEKIRTLEGELETAREALAEVEARLQQRGALEEELQTTHRELEARRAENAALRPQMNELKARIDQLAEAEGSQCPLCGQPLSEDERETLVAHLTAEGKAMGDRFRANKEAIKALEERVAALEENLAAFKALEEEHLKHTTTISEKNAQLEALRQVAVEWEQRGAKRLSEVVRALETEEYAQEARRRLVEIDEALKALGYDAAAHEAARRAEQEGRSAEEAFHELRAARTRLESLEREIETIQADLRKLDADIAKQEADYRQAADALAKAEAQAPDIEAAEQALFELKEQENAKNQEVGAARQKVTVLDDLRARRADLEAQREDLALRIGRHRQLERAFGKDGIPALLIEQALPQIESKANELLDRLSEGSMSIRFVTQAPYKDKRRQDMRETLDIQISDGAGVRAYEMYSGGEAFRVNFAIRLALSKILSQRKGARLQTLVIDEGFGSQDAQGRQRLIEAINLVREDFAKILVITHLDELKDAFPTRIEVEKTAHGSTLRVV